MARFVKCETIPLAAPVIILGVPARMISNQDRLQYQHVPLFSRIDPGPVAGRILPLTAYPETVVS